MSITITEIILRNACQLALQMNIKTLLIVSERKIKKQWLEKTPKELKVIIALSEQNEIKSIDKNSRFRTLTFPYSRLSRFSKIRSILIAALSKGYITETEKIICLNGSIRNKTAFDSIDFINMETQFKGLKHLREHITKHKIQLNVIASAMDTAVELGEFGREGKRYGSIFIIGDAQNVLSLSKQITFNPFKSVKDDDRNIKNMLTKECVLEFSKLDGAFIVRGDGLVCAAGRLLFMPKGKVKILRGLGSRHNAAAYITRRTKAIGIVVSETSGAVSIFVKGKLLFRLKHYLIEGRSS